MKWRLTPGPSLHRHGDAAAAATLPAASRGPGSVVDRALDPPACVRPTFPVQIAASHGGGDLGKPRILIAGAGIGGIVAALALLQRGFEVALYDQAAELRELGAGVQISPNGSRVLRELGLLSAMQAIASVPTAKEMRLFNTGQAWRVQDLGANAEARYGSPYLVGASRGLPCRPGAGTRRARARRRCVSVRAARASSRRQTA